MADGKRRSGFSLVELLCALAVACALLAVALPRASASLERASVEQAARRLASEIELARLKAINRNGRARVIVEIDRASYRVELESEGRFSPEGSPRALPGGVRFDAAASSRVAAGQISITFQPRGNTVDNSTIAIAGGPGDRRRVIVSSTGRVRLA